LKEACFKVFLKGFLEVWALANVYEFVFLVVESVDAGFWGNVSCFLSPDVELVGHLISTEECSLFYLLLMIYYKRRFEGGEDES